MSAIFEAFDVLDIIIILVCFYCIYSAIRQLMTKQNYLLGRDADRFEPEAAAKTIVPGALMEIVFSVALILSKVFREILGQTTAANVFFVIALVFAVATLVLIFSCPKKKY